MAHEHFSAVLVRVDPSVFDGHEFGWQLPEGRIGRTLSRAEAEHRYPQAAERADYNAAHHTGECVFCAHLSN